MGLIEFNIFRGKLVFRHPENAGVRNIFLQPFSTTIWLLLFAIVMFSSLLLYLTYVHLKRNFSKHDFIYSESILTLVGVMASQGFTETFNKISTRLVLLFAVLFSLLIFQFYSSFIVASLLTPTPKTIKTLRNFIDSKLKVGIEDVSYNKDFFEAIAIKLLRQFSLTIFL